MATTAYKDWKYTIEHIDDYHIKVRVYRKGERKIFDTFVIGCFEDWNIVEDDIHTVIDQLKVSKKK